MTLNEIPNCSKEEYMINLRNKYDNSHCYERSFYYGLWCIKDTMREISEGSYRALLPYTEYPLNDLIENIEIHSGDETYFEESCSKLEELYNKLLIGNMICIEKFGTEQQKGLVKKLLEPRTNKQ